MFLNKAVGGGVLFVILKVLVAMPFLTLLERKILSYSQGRKGPKKVSFLGLLQPVSDGVKLIIKTFSVPLMSKKILFFILPLLSFLCMLLSWFMFPFFFSSFFIPFSVLIVLCVSSFAVYMILFSGWSSKSKYALLGSLRGASQSISYEMSLMILMLLPCSLKFSLDFLGFLKKMFPLIFVFPLVFLIWFMKCLAETNRAPFDFAEGESELVSGFKVEFSSLKFAFFFLGEYGMMLFFSFVSSLMFFSLSYIFVFMFSGVLVLGFMMARSSFPRFRYDLLMSLAWKVFLPISLFSLFFPLILYSC